MSVDAWEDIQKKQQAQDKWLNVILLVLLLIALAMVLQGCPRPVPPPSPPPPDGGCAEACKQMKSKCPSAGDFCACNTVTDPNYAPCLLKALNQTEKDPCQAASECDVGTGN